MTSGKTIAFPDAVYARVQAAAAAEGTTVEALATEAILVPAG